MHHARLAVAALLSALAVGCGDGDETGKAPVDTSQRSVEITTPGGNTALARIPRQISEPFLQTCLQERGTKARSLCGCILVRLSKRTTRRELSVIARAGRTPDVSSQRKLETAAKVCTQQR